MKLTISGSASFPRTFLGYLEITLLKFMTFTDFVNRPPSVRVRYPSLADVADMHLAVRNAKGQMDNGDVKAHCYSSPKGWPFIGCPSEHHSTASVPR